MGEPKMMALFLGGPRHGLTSDVQDGHVVVYVDAQPDEIDYHLWANPDPRAMAPPKRWIYVRKELVIFDVMITVWVPDGEMPTLAQLAEILLSPIAKQAISDRGV